MTVGNCFQVTHGKVESARTASPLWVRVVSEGVGWEVKVSAERMEREGVMECWAHLRGGGDLSSCQGRESGEDLWKLTFAIKPLLCSSPNPPLLPHDLSYEFYYNLSNSTNKFIEGASSSVPSFHFSKHEVSRATEQSEICLASCRPAPSRAPGTLGAP